MFFRDNLHYELDKQEMLIKELSAKTNISESTLKSYLKKDSVEPKATNAVIIAKALGVTVEYLVTGNSENGAGSAKPVSREANFIAETFDRLSENDRKSVLALVKEMKSHNQ